MDIPVSHFRLAINIDNEAFQPDATRELGRILTDLKAKLEDDGLPTEPIIIRDSNGNRIGDARVTVS